MRVRLLAFLLLAAFVAAPTPVSAQSPSDVVCITNAVPNPVRETRYFCEPMDSTFFVQFDQFLDGLEDLQAAYPDFIEVKKIGTSVEGRPILFVEVTNEKSTVPRAERLQLGYSASIHANEAAGREGMTRVIEDLAAGVGPYGAALKPMLDRTIVNVWFPNPDSWAQGDYFAASDVGGVHPPVGPECDGPLGIGVPVCGFQRGNANGYDLNRQFPNPGWILPEHEPMSQPEARAIVSELRYSGNHANLVAGSDLHGMLSSQNMIRSIIPNQDYDFRRMVLIVDQMRQIGERVEANPAYAEWMLGYQTSQTLEQVIGQDVPVIPDPTGGGIGVDKPYLWGARWDQIGYTDTGFTSDYITLSPRSPTGGMGAVGQIVEFAYSHQVPDNHYVAKLTDMHVAGVREIVRTQMEQAFRLESPQLAGTGAIAYIDDGSFVSSDDDPNFYGADKPTFNLNSDEAKFDFQQVPYKVSNLNFWRDLGRFSADPVVPLAPAKVSLLSLSAYKHLAITDQALDSLSDDNVRTIQAWVNGGGHVLLTDSALRFFDRAEMTGGSAGRLCVYIGHSDIQDPSHPLLAGVDWNIRTTGEASAIGIGATEDGAENYPEWGLDEAAFTALGGQLVGTTGTADTNLGRQMATTQLVAPPILGTNAEKCQPTTQGRIVSLGRIPLGAGSFDLLGGALPMPTQAWDHRYGLADYSVAALTYWVVMNSFGGQVDYKAIDTPFIPTYDFDPLYGAQSTDDPVHTPESKDTPALGLPLLAAALAALALSRRRLL